ncbi:uncharacterized protein LOC117808021 [Notolabrus celidotus]|uniref:uncharacterized protein LOC117808021 n=1 Tax=Notolabrus celidotus TaxID=1203425 RepID=UPI001490043D|nr:uncharacterized protein LOC117808021 [Notolabrus celidotus]
MFAPLMLISKHKGASTEVMQTYTVHRTRTVVVSGVPDVLPLSRMIDKLTIHFQRHRRSHGGDVDAVRYPTNINGVAFVTFDRREDAERVLQKEEQIMSDSEFPVNFSLTVFPFSEDVFLYVPRALVDLSVFGSNQASLIQSLQSAHRSLRFRPSLKKRKATIEGPFAAIQALRNDLIHRASRLKSNDSAQTAPDKIRETPLNPRVISHPELVHTVSRSRSKAKPKPVNSLSTGLQTTGEATGVQSPLLDAETQNASRRLKVQERGCAEGCFGDTDEEEVEEESSQTRVEMPTEFRNEQVLKEGMNARIRRSSSGVYLPLAAEMSANGKRRKDDTTRKHTTPDGTFGKAKTKSHTGSQKESDQNSSSITSVSNSSRRKNEDPKETCILVDSNIFQYIKKFARKDLDKCLRGLGASIESNEGSDLVRVIWTETQTSGATSGIQQALDDLQFLVESWVTTLRVHEIDFGKEEGLDKQELIKVCDELSDTFDDSLYMFQGSRIKIVAPSVSSRIFYILAESRISKLRKQTLLNAVA